MEEILASIRRIIEDNEAGRTPADLDPDKPVESTVIEVDAFRADLRAAEEREVPWPEAAGRKPPRLAEARAEAATEHRTAASAGWGPETTPRPRFVETSQPRAGDIEAPPADTASGADQAAAPETAADVRVKPPADLVPTEGEASQNRPAILSEHAERKVAAAFGELSEAFASRSRKTFDDLAERMLQPMLQDWLDNNLPGLVERLVREEIERVARGS